ncbi:TetR family transcriptional regulator [Streptomyces sp. NPDC090499]|uniref:acyl-CoA-like ligand-binding transcription factor n=1 Tax=Streptomyces sp. NPDC090499 TaxID=3365965 RepID=UPI00380D9C9E
MTESSTPLQPRLRQAMRAEVARVATALFATRGFENVTVPEVAAAAGVSRATFFRYFGSKEDAVLAALEGYGARIAEALAARPAGEDAWTALRCAFAVITDARNEDPEGGLALARLIESTPSLRTRETEKYRHWQETLSGVLAERLGRGKDDFETVLRAAAALTALELATRRWAQNDGADDLGTLIDQAFLVMHAPAPDLL